MFEAESMVKGLANQFANSYHICLFSCGRVDINECDIAGYCMSKATKEKKSLKEIKEENDDDGYGDEDEE